MKVVRLRLRNFRNIEECTFEPSSNINFLIGKNGQGKTSFLEALSFIATLRSFRGAKSEEVIHWGSSVGEVSCEITQADWHSELKVHFQKTPTSNGVRTSKTAFIDSKPYRSSTQFLSRRFGEHEVGFHAVVFNPADHDLVRGEPALRRSYLDRVLSAEDVGYLKILQRYQKTLEHRNALLKEDSPPSPEVLAGFTEPLALAGAQIVRARLEWISRVHQPLLRVAHEIAPTQPAVEVIYQSAWLPEVGKKSFKNNKLRTIHFTGHPDLPSLELLEQAFWTQVSALHEAEWRARTTLVGPHRDDWAFLIGDQPLKGHGSQGEVRSALLALKLSEIQLFQERTGHEPVLLLDDFSSELDRERREYLLRYLEESGLQAFVTATEAVKCPAKFFRVESGKVHPISDEGEKEGIYGN